MGQSFQVSEAGKSLRGMAVTIFSIAVIEVSVRGELLALAWPAVVRPSLARGLGMFGRRSRSVVTGER